MFALLLELVPLISALQKMMLFVGTSSYMEPNLLLLIMFENATFLIIKILFVFNINICILPFPHRIMVGVITLIEVLLRKLFKLPCFVFCLCE
jgi:hypothetical protein